MSVASEITRLQGAKSDLKTSINAKLSGTAITNETIDDYASFVDQIQTGGGGSEPTTLAELDTIINNFYQNNFLSGTNQPYTQNALTLYTPDADFNKYYIRKRSDTGTYAIAWFHKDTKFLQIYNPAVDAKTYDSIELANYGSKYKINSQNVSYIYFSAISSYGSFYYSTNNYNTFEDALLAIQNPNTSYTLWSSGSSINNDVNYIGYSNTEYYYFSNGQQPTHFYKLSNLSSNETIEVIV